MDLIKVITSCQNNIGSSANSVSGRSSSSRNGREDKEYFFGEETLDSKWKTTDLDTTSVSSLEEWINDSSVGTKKYVDKLTLTIKQDIEELSHSESEHEDDDSAYFRKKSYLNDDDANWLLKKRQFHGTHSPVPVPMLVPDPTEEAKVLIGDKEVDDTSDLSDVASEFGDNESVSPIKKILVKSKTIIGGKNDLESMSICGSDGELSVDSGVRDARDFDEMDNSNFEEKNILIEAKNPKTDINLDDDNIEDSSILSVYSNTEKDTEYTEKYGSLPRTIIKQVTKFGNDYCKSQAALPSGAYKTEGNLPTWPPIKHQSSEDEESIFTARPAIILDDSDDQEIEQKIEPRIISPVSSKNTVNSILDITSDSDLSFINFYDVENSKVIRKSSNGNIIPSNSNELFVLAEPKLTYYEPEASKEDDYVLPEPRIVEMTGKDEDGSPIYSSYKKSNILQEAQKEETDDSTKKHVSRIEIEDLNGNLRSEKDKHIQTKAKPTAKPRTKESPIVRQMNNDQTKGIRRYKSVSDIAEDSFETFPTVLKPKKDNTIISKIYMDPNVRKTGLSNRDYIPHEEKEKNMGPEPVFKKQMSLDARIFAKATAKSRNINDTTKPVNNYSDDESVFEIQEVHTDVYDTSEESSDFYISISRVKSPERYSSHESLKTISEHLDNFKEETRALSIKEEDPVYAELSEKKIVKTRLGQFSQSQPNLNLINKSLCEDEKYHVSVHQLAKIFESNKSIKNEEPISSLTARSISKEMMEKLRR